MNLRSVLTATILVAASVALHAELSWGNKDYHYPRTYKIHTAVTDTTVAAWGGERVGALALFTTETDGAVSAKLSGPLAGNAMFVDYVLTDRFRACGIHPDNLEAYDVPDVISDASTMVKAGETRPLWVTVEVPRGLPAGEYVDTLSVDGEKIPLRLNVSSRTLPAPDKWSFYLNLWQQPYAVSRYYNVKPWSQEHFELLKPYAQMLARAGQRTISTILFFEPWGEQSNDLFLPMVETSRNIDGSWDYDYSVFDRWVEFMTENGVGPDIECFSMVPWEMNFRYFDRTKGDYQFLKTTTDAPEYRELWSNFLSAFHKHLREKGWENRAVIAMDERSMTDMKNAIDIVDSTAPGLKISLAGNYHPEIANRIYSLAITQGDQYPPGVIEARRDKGQFSSLYTCCSSPEPNLFSNSEPADAAWLPVHCVATGHDGYLHWSWMNWTDSPLSDTRFKLFAPGDTYFVYPDAKSSVRFERLIEGIELSEKIRALKAEFIKNGDAHALAELDNALTVFGNTRPRTNASTSKQIQFLNNLIKKYDQK